MNKYESLEKNLEKIFNQHEKIAIAFSGGSDSMFLFRFILDFCEKKFFNFKKKYIFYILSINHLVRDESSLEINFIQKFISYFKINVKIFEINHESSKLFKNNFHNNAHIIRYNLMLKFCSKENITCILTAHHKEDQKETFFMRLEKASSIKSLTGIKFESIFNEKFLNIKIFRPMLFLEKQDILSFLSMKNQIYIHDRSNQNAKYHRSIIRKQISSNKFFNYFNKNFDLLMKKINNTSDAIEFYINKAFNKYIKEEKDQIIIDNQIFFFEPKEIIIQILKKIFINFNRIKQMRIEYTKLEEIYNDIFQTLKKKQLKKIFIFIFIVEIDKYFIFIKKSIRNF